jgi:hypothetical protein
MYYACKYILSSTKKLAYASLACLQCGQSTEAMVHALINYQSVGSSTTLDRIYCLVCFCQSVGPFWVNVLRFISDQVDLVPDADAILQLRLPADTHICQSTIPVPLTSACSLWAHYACIRCIYAEVSLLIHSFMAE